ncbi:MAG TPA: hypothetical protein VIT23_16840 [Terrimicrobiaceae bacterium]
MIISHLLLVLGAAVLSAALRSFQHPLLFRLGTLGIVGTSFLAGWLLGGSLVLGVALAGSWLFLPWLEILTRVRRMRIPMERRLEPRRPPTRNSFPGFQEMTEEIESEGFEHLDDIGWDYKDNHHFYRIFHDQERRTQASICLTEQHEMAFYYLTITSRTEDGRILMTWNYPFSYGLKLQPHLLTNRFQGQGPFSEMHDAHQKFLQSNNIDSQMLLDHSSEDTIRTMQNEMHAQITHNIALGLLARDGDNLIRYTLRGMFYLWVQFLRDLVRLS